MRLYSARNSNQDCKMPYRRYLEQLDNSQKEYLFRADLARRLTVMNYLIAKPEPDVGEDFWISSRQQNIIFPAQLKSSFSIQHLHNDTVRRYLTNIKARKMESTLGRKFLYFFGLYEPNSNPAWFHIGCIPSSFFENHWEFLKRRKLQKDGRVNIEIDYYVTEGRYFMFMNPLIEITPFFNSLDTIL